MNENNMPSQFNWKRYEGWIAILVIAIVTILNYGILLNQLGYYKEDWYIIWAGITQGPGYLIKLFEGERPLVGYLFSLLYPLLGTNPLAWHVYAFAIRLCGAYVFLWLLRLIWPQKPTLTIITALLFVSYPGFQQQVQANNFQFHLTTLLFAILSISLTIYSVKTKNRVLQILAIAGSVITALIYPLLIEHYIGIEALRLILLWYVLKQNTLARPKSMIMPFVVRLVPVWIADGLFLFWRLFIFESTRHTTDVSALIASYQANAIFMLARMFIELIRDTFETLFMGWFIPLDRFLYWDGYPTFLTALLLGVCTAVFVGIFIKFSKRNHNLDKETEENNSITKNMLWIGLLATIAALIPALASNQEVRFDLFTRLDRFTLPASLGAALFISGFLYTYIKSRYRAFVIISLLCLATMAHFDYSKYMQDFWEVQRQVWWQLSWRAPGIQKETTLVINLPPDFSYAEGYEAWAPANIIYYQEPGPPPIVSEVLLPKTAFEIFKGDEKARNYRSIRLKRNFKNSLIASIPTQFSCLNVIDGSKYELNQEESPLVREIAPYSKIDRIITDVAFQKPSQQVFGKEPKHTWCYYYQKAMYARQIGDWHEIAQLGDEVIAKQLSPYDSTEWMPFVEGYASIGREVEAHKIADLLKTMNPIGRYTICQQMINPPSYPEGYNYQTVNELVCMGGNE